MPFHCPICSNIDYEEEDGLYFCRECGTQSQEFHVQEVAEETMVGTFGGSHQVRSIKSQKNPPIEKKSIVGRPWTVYEGFQFILLSQADALVELGADISLPQTIFTIWSNYLSKIGVAFCKNEKVIPDVIKETKVGRIRELHRGSFDNPLNIGNFAKRINRSKQKVKSSDDKCAFDDDNFEDIEDLVEEGIINEEEEHYTQTRYQKTKRYAERSPEYMNMRKTLSLCYIGLMISNPTILPCDLVRWVYEGRIPYLSPSHVIPEDMAFSAEDEKTFCAEIGTVELLMTTDRLLKFLGLRNLPVNPVELLINRFIEELFLPDELKRICFNLVDKIGLHVFAKNIHTYQKQEKLAVAYIILALRMIVGVNGTTESYLSRSSIQIQKLISTSDIIVFNWEEWRKFMCNKPHLEFCPFSETHKEISRSRLNHLDDLLKWFSSLNRDKKKLPYSKFAWSDHGVCARGSSEFSAALQKPLVQALKKLEIGKSGNQREILQDQLSVKKDNFKRSTLKHIIDKPAFRKSFRNLDQENREKLKRLLSCDQQNATIELLSYTSVKNDSMLRESRQAPYFWLLQLCHQVIAPQAKVARSALARLDHLVITLQNMLINPSYQNNSDDMFFDGEQDLFD